MNTLGSARRQRGLSLEDIANATRLSPRFVRAIDEGRFDELPAGVYARNYVRLFAAVVGVEPSAVDDVLPLLPAVDDPLAAIEETVSRRRTRIASFDFLRPWAAPLVDALLLLALNAFEVIVGAAACGLSSAALVHAAPFPLTLVCATTWIEYFLLFAGIHGRTAGELICGIPPRPAATPLRLNTILQRAFAVVR